MPEIVVAMRLVMVAAAAVKVEMTLVVKLERTEKRVVDVALVVEALVEKKFVVVALVATKFVLNAFVLVAFVVVLFVTLSPVMVASVEVKVSMIPVVKRPRVAKKFVVVAFVPVAFTNVKSCRVVEPVSRRFAVVTVPVAETLATFVILPEKNPLPCTAKFREGEVVPMPTLPVVWSTKNCDVPIEKLPANVLVAVVDVAVKYGAMDAP